MKRFLLVPLALLALAGCGGVQDGFEASSAIDPEPSGDYDLKAWVISNDDAITEVVDANSDVSDEIIAASEDMDFDAMRTACVHTDTVADMMDEISDGAPAEWITAANEFHLASSTCLDGDFDSSADHLGSAADEIGTLGAVLQGKG
jgi:hypothetical protein